MQKTYVVASLAKQLNVVVVVVVVLYIVGLEIFVIDFRWKDIAKGWC